MFYDETLRKLLHSGAASVSDSVLILCGNANDERVLKSVGFTRFDLSNIETVDAENIAHADNSVDISIVHCGLHHCASPHRALCEMYRVARKLVVVFEARDSLAVRIASKLGLTMDYEVEAVIAEGWESGGMRNGPIPNYVYRWTEREVMKTIRSYEPRFEPRVQFFHGLRVPVSAARIAPMAKAFVRAFPSQANELAFSVVKPGTLMPWLQMNAAGQIEIDRAAAKTFAR